MEVLSGRAWIPVAALVAAASLLVPASLAFDPEAWLLWSRALVHGHFTTVDGPSWKPLPLVLLAPLSLLGLAKPAFWLLLARTGALLALPAAWRLARGLGGTRLAGAVAVVLVVLSPWWAFNAWLGNAEGILAAAVLWAAVHAREGRPRAAIAAAWVAALIRPELWPFALLAAGWAWWRLPAVRGWVAAAVASALALWFAPDLLGAGGALRASDAARGRASPGSAANTEDPALEVLWFAVRDLGPAAVIGLAVLGATSWRRGGRRPPAPSAPPSPARGVAPVTSTVDVTSANLPRTGRATALVAGSAAAYVALISLATGAGYAGNARYLVPALALGAVLGAVGLARAPRVGLVAAAVALAVVSLPRLADQRVQLAQRLASDRALSRALVAAGGTKALKACGPVRSSYDARAAVARRFDVPFAGLDARHAAVYVEHDAATDRWWIRSACSPFVASASGRPPVAG